MASIDQQLRDVETTSREVLPLMQRMLDTLGQFVDLDAPFLLDERKNRVAMLETMMPRADVTLSEKYRRIVEAYQVEMDYGRTLEAYEAKLGDGDDARTVQFLRVGRVALLYQTLDGKETGYWDARDEELGGRQRLPARLQGGHRGRQEAARARDAARSPCRRRRKRSRDALPDLA